MDKIIEERDFFYVYHFRITLVERASGREHEIRFKMKDFEGIEFANALSKFPFKHEAFKFSGDEFNEWLVKNKELAREFFHSEDDLKEMVYYGLVNKMYEINDGWVS